MSIGIGIGVGIGIGIYSGVGIGKLGSCWSSGHCQVPAVVIGQRSVWSAPRHLHPMSADKTKYIYCYWHSFGVIKIIVIGVCTAECWASTQSSVVTARSQQWSLGRGQCDQL